ncbi:DUF6082 family protein [Streptomyces sp. NPDC057552]|uniref:DUF6082 family protein n=1 Tax=Streptomyces sp. NPDC057552 TaxID=3350537 RepID=UPI0036BBC973
MKNKTLAASGLLLSVGLGAAHLALTVKHHREKNHLNFVRLHADLLRHTAADPRLNENTNYGEFVDLSDDDRARFMNANAWVTLWSVMLRLGYLPRASVRQVAAEFMSGPVGREFWKRARNHRRVTARDKHDEQFNDLMNEAYAEAAQAPVAA